MAGSLGWVWKVGFFLCLIVGVAACSSVEGAQSSHPSTTIISEWQPLNDEISPNGHVVAPDEHLQAALERAGPDSTVVVGTGVHRLGNIQPESGQTIVGEPGAILSGAEIIKGFRQQGEVWVASAPAVIREEGGKCREERPACGWPQDLFVDGHIVPRVAEAAELDETSWFLDFGTDLVVLGFDPGDTIVELSVHPTAIGGPAPDVTVRGLVIEKYAPLAQSGAVNPRKGWSIERNEIRWNHAIGIKTAGGVTITGNYLHHNGQFAIAGGGINLTIEGNEIAHNGIAGYSSLWAAGGTKFINTHNLVVKDNFVYQNVGPGLWTDGAQDETVYTGNRVLDNEHAGIKHEISGSAEIRNNEITGNGFGHSVDLRGAGILIRESGPTEVISNAIAGNSDQLILLQQDERQNDTGNRLDAASIRDNQITLGNGMVGYSGDIVTEEAIVFADNDYTGDPSIRSFLALGDELTFEAWVDEGRDLGATLTSPTDG